MLTEQETEYYLTERESSCSYKSSVHVGKHVSQFVRAVFQSQAHDPSILLMCNNQTMPFFSKKPKTLIMSKHHLHIKWKPYLDKISNKKNLKIPM